MLAQTSVGIGCDAHLSLIDQTNVKVVGSCVRSFWPFCLRVDMSGGQPAEIIGNITGLTSPICATSSSSLLHFNGFYLFGKNEHVIHQPRVGALQLFAFMALNKYLTQ